MLQQLPLYEQIARRIVEQISLGIYRTGDRLPSIRELSRRRSVGINTVREAYYRLEAAGIIELRPRSGAFVCTRDRAVPVASSRDDHRCAESATTSELWHRVHKDVKNPDLSPLGIFALDEQILPADALARTLGSVVRRSPARSLRLPDVRGEEQLRRALARRCASSVGVVGPEDVLITSGCTDGVFLALTVLTAPGDTVVVEHPFFTSALQLWESLNLTVFEVPSSPVTGVDVQALELAFRERSPAACILVSTFSNPLGSTIPAENKQRIARLSAEYQIPVIEDDVFGELPYDGVRRATIKSFDTDGYVILVSSFSKTIAPGFRTGWIVPGRYVNEVERLKMATPHASATPIQIALAEFLDSGRFERHIRRLQRTYARSMTSMVQTVERYFPHGTTFSVPQGGLVFWVELPEPVDTVALYDRARDARIAIAPGTIFTLTGGLRNGLRLSCARWDEHIQRGVETLGKLAHSG